MDYFPACMDRASADVVLRTDDGTRLEAHRDVLCRMCGLFATIYDDDVPMEGHVLPVSGHATRDVRFVLFAMYHVACLADLMDEDDGVTAVDTLVNTRLLAAPWRDVTDFGVCDDLDYDDDDLRDVEEEEEEVEEDDLSNGGDVSLRKSARILQDFILWVVVGSSHLKGFVVAADFLQMRVLADLFYDERFPLHNEASFLSAVQMCDDLEGVPSLLDVRARCVTALFQRSVRDHRDSRGLFPTVHCLMREFIKDNPTSSMLARVNRLGQLMAPQYADGAPQLPHHAVLALCDGIDVPPQPFDETPPPGSVPLALAMVRPCRPCGTFLTRLAVLTSGAPEATDPQEPQMLLVSLTQRTRSFLDPLHGEHQRHLVCEASLSCGPAVDCTVLIKAWVYHPVLERYATRTLHTWTGNFDEETKVCRPLGREPLVTFMEDNCDPFGNVHFFVTVVQ